MQALSTRTGGIIRKLFGAVIVVLVLAVVGLGYLGFVPGLSSVFGSDKPRDLGVSVSSDDAQTIAAKLGVEYATLSSGSGETLAISGSKAIDDALSDRELTALMREHEKMWKHYPISDARVRFNADGTAELSGILRTDRIYGYAEATGIPADAVKKYLDIAKIAIANPPIYLKGKVVVNNGVMTTSFERLEIGRLPIPVSRVADESGVAQFASNRLEKAGVRVETASFEAGRVNFKGSIPTSVGFAGE
jgi:hypothetical protein